MRLVAGARQDLRAQRRALALERRADGGGDRRVDRAREREPLGRRPVGVRRRGGRAQRPLRRRASPSRSSSWPSTRRISSAVATFPAASPRRRLAVSWSMNAPIFSQRATSFQPSAARAHRLQLGQAQEDHLHAVARVDRPVVQRAAAEREIARRSRPAAAPASPDRPADSAAAGTASTRARSAASAAISRSRAAGVLSGSRSSNRRSPISVACSGCACRCASQYRRRARPAPAAGASPASDRPRARALARHPLRFAPKAGHRWSGTQAPGRSAALVLANARVTGGKT